MTVHLEFLNLAVELATQNAATGAGGPFGAIIVREGRILASGANRVTATNDPTAHAEIVAIRAACAALDSFQLEGCDVYCSCEPCPMCLSALYWARPRAVYYASTHLDASAAGFDDRFIYEQIAVPPQSRTLRMVHLPQEGDGEPFARWKEARRRVDY